MYPTLDDKRDIVQNAIDLAHALGIAMPKVAILSAIETVSTKLRSTLDAAALCKMADRGQIIGGVIDGPRPQRGLVQHQVLALRGDGHFDGTPLCMGAVDGIGHAARFHAAAGQGSVLFDTNLGEAKTHEAALSSLLQWLERRFTANHLRAAGHRVVHGGSHFTAPTLIDG